MFGNQCLGTGTKWCCVHTLSTRNVTVYIVTPFRPVSSLLHSRFECRHATLLRGGGGGGGGALRDNTKNGYVADYPVRRHTELTISATCLIWLDP